MSDISKHSVSTLVMLCSHRPPNGLRFTHAVRLKPQPEAPFYGRSLFRFTHVTAVIVCWSLSAAVKKVTDAAVLYWNVSCADADRELKLSVLTCCFHYEPCEDAVKLLSSGVWP